MGFFFPDDEGKRIIRESKRSLEDKKAAHNYTACYCATVNTYKENCMHAFYPFVSICNDKQICKVAPNEIFSLRQRANRNKTRNSFQGENNTQLNPPRFIHTILLLSTYMYGEMRRRRRRRRRRRDDVFVRATPLATRGVSLSICMQKTTLALHSSTKLFYERKPGQHNTTGDR